MTTFLLVCAGRLITALGSSISGFALGLWIYQQTGSVTQFATGLLLGFAPGMLAAPAAGVLVDRYRRRTVLLCADAAAMIAAVAMALSQSTGHLAVWQVYAVTVLESCCAAFQWPALAAAVTGMVRPEQRGRAGAMTQTALAVAQLLGPMLAATLLGVGGLRAVLVVDVASFALGLFTVLAAHFPEPPGLDGNRGRSGQRRGWRRELSEGRRLLTAQPGLRHLLRVVTVFNAAEATATALLLPLVLSSTPPAQQNAAVALVSTCGGLGLAVSSVAMSICRLPRRPMLWITSATVLSGGAVLLAGLHPRPGLLAGAAFTFFLGLPVVTGCAQVLWQSAVAAEAQGRVFALRRMFTQGGTMLGFLLAGPLASQVCGPLVDAGGPLASTVGRLLTTARDRGSALLLCCTGLALALIALTGRRHTVTALAAPPDADTPPAPDTPYAAKSPRPPSDRLEPEAGGTRPAA
ncbi:MFS transporter [Streptomyces sp. NBC_00083]|uniref:MFS transporter n=1 Tax=Streptomyces sp. NBC_00083 TaxID=2975647 RepID=UPI00225097A7|nr:MFS transporter [Streptomyces sp. NBC_00083]MCX5387041.1 MFS transporter [Streptomyces sp. NBC_00083]